MNKSDWIIIGFALFFSIGEGIRFWMSSRREQGYAPSDDDPIFLHRGNGVLTSRAIFYLLAALLLSSSSSFIAAYGITTLLLGLFFGVLLLFRPVYREILRAESCASLWGLMWIAILFQYLCFRSNYSPRWFLSLPFPYPDGHMISWIIGIWLVGFVGVMLWSILSHIRFRRYLLKEARPLEDPVALEAYRKQQRILRFYPEHITLWVSEKTVTPVSIGLFLRTIRIVLPDREYTQEELELIFRHELVHISRRDGLTKLEMTIGCALCWFNPLVWLATRACAGDLELSCDEAVLYGYHAQVQKKYAGLLLQTTATERGFTTCLSASAKALRYRLKRVVKPKKRLPGGIFAAVLSLALTLSFSYIGVRFQPEQANYLIFQNQDLGSIQVGDIIITSSQVSGDGGECVQDQALLEYIGSLSVRRVSGAYDVSTGAHTQIIADSEETGYMLTLSEKHLRVVTIAYKKWGPNSMKTEYYEVCSRLDWDFIRQCLEEA